MKKLTQTAIEFVTAQGLEAEGQLVRLGRLEIVFNVFGPDNVLRTSEVIGRLKVVSGGHVLYEGRATVSSLVAIAGGVTCQADLDEPGLQVPLSPGELQPGRMPGLAKEHLHQWQQLCLIRPEYKLLIADIESFFAELRVWLEQVEVAIRSAPSKSRHLENEIALEIGASILPSIDALWEKFEHMAEGLEPATRTVHRTYMQRRLHPLILCAPFVHRSFTKPLGYAGDYEMVNMIARNGAEGGSLYAKVVNLIFIRQPPADAHRNRLKFLTQRLVEEAARAAAAGREARIFSLACGPAIEVQDFLREHELSNRTELTLLDFNEETLDHVTAAFADLKSKLSRRTPVQFIQRSIHHLLKESVRTGPRPASQQYDFVYCAGLFDYLTDAVCQRLMTLLYDWVAPGGLLLATNVDATLNDLRSFRHALDFILDWHLIYRRSSQFSALVPASIHAERSVKSDETGVNLFLELRKPSNG